MFPKSAYEKRPLFSVASLWLFFFGFRIAKLRLRCRLFGFHGLQCEMMSVIEDFLYLEWNEGSTLLPICQERGARKAHGSNVVLIISLCTLSAFLRRARTIILLRAQLKSPTN